MCGAPTRHYECGGRITYRACVASAEILRGLQAVYVQTHICAPRRLRLPRVRHCNIVQHVCDQPSVLIFRAAWQDVAWTLVDRRIVAG
jgi:hypothetical protein